MIRGVWDREGWMGGVYVGGGTHGLEKFHSYYLHHDRVTVTQDFQNIYISTYHLHYSTSRPQV